MLSSIDLLLSECIGMGKYAGCTIVPESIVELWFMRQLICTYHHRAEESLYLFFRCIDRIHIDLVLAIVGAEFDNIGFACDYILYLELVEDSLEGIERLSSLLAKLG